MNGPIVVVNSAWRGALVGFGSFVVVFLSGLYAQVQAYSDDTEFVLHWVDRLSYLTASLFYVTPIFWKTWPRIGQVVATIGCVLAVIVAIPGLIDHPGIALLYITCVIFVLLAIWPPRLPPAVTTSLDLCVESGRSGYDWQEFSTGFAAATLLTWLTAVVLPSPHRLDVPLIVAAFELACGFLVFWSVRHSGISATRRRFWTLLLTVPVAGAFFSWSSPAALVIWLVPLPLAAMIGPRVSEVFVTSTNRWWEPLLDRPAPLLVSTFAAICAVGWVLLLIPISSASGYSVSSVDALFTSISATCVTGLSTVDTATSYGFFGQAVILLLIQVGGLGIMTLYTAAFTLMGRRLSLRHEGAVANLVSYENRGDLTASLKRVLLLTLTGEFVGAMLLTALFWSSGDSAGSALWRGLFTSVSAFCNAGFALQSDSLVGYQNNPWILHTVSMLIIVGGLGPAVAGAVVPLVKRRYTPLRAKLAIWMTIFLLFGGFVLYAALEWNHSLAGLTAFDRLHNAWFQSVTLRTAGFNSVDISATHVTTLNLMLAWMFIGGCPGSTAGGIKTTTAALLLIAVWAAISGRDRGTAFRVRVPHSTVYKAAALTTISIVVHLAAFSALELTQSISPGAALFEVVSAMGTVGLTIGATAQLDDVGKVIVMICMFIGRVGPLTLFLLLGDQRSKGEWERPEEDVPVG
ncbi:MAG: potassium transporter TrkH [Myxococcales bacterium]|nr:potassium transporter TrkH [Myxococcales bacterium]